jgi:hypothetical protein
MAAPGPVEAVDPLLDVTSYLPEDADEVDVNWLQPIGGNRQP